MGKIDFTVTQKPEALGFCAGHREPLFCSLANPPRLCAFQGFIMDCVII